MRSPAVRSVTPVRSPPKPGVLAVFDTRHALQGLHGHRSKVASGYVQVGQTADLAIDSPRRERIRKSHTGTHVLHWALREVLGGHAHQAGSLVESGRLRFDFSHFSAVAPTEIAEIESLANHRLIENGHVTTTITTKEEAERQGALAFFGDKYGETVRLVKIGQFSAELCGGTHTHTAAQVGPLIVLGESSIGSNIRRIEALTGESAYQHITEWRSTIDEAARLLTGRARGGAGPGPEPSQPDRGDGRVSSTRIGSATGPPPPTNWRAQPSRSGSAKLRGRQLAEFERRATAPPGYRRPSRSSGRGMVCSDRRSAGKDPSSRSPARTWWRRGFPPPRWWPPGPKLLGGGGSRDPELAQAGGPTATSSTPPWQQPTRLPRPASPAFRPVAYRGNPSTGPGRVLGLDHGTRRVGIASVRRTQDHRPAPRSGRQVERRRPGHRNSWLSTKSEKSSWDLPTSLEGSRRTARHRGPRNSAMRSLRPPESTSVMSTSGSRP